MKQESFEDGLQRRINEAMYAWVVELREQVCTLDEDQRNNAVGPYDIDAERRRIESLIAQVEQVMT